VAPTPALINTTGRVPARHKGPAWSGDVDHVADLNAVV
jgi:hypothetical protein